MLILAMIFALAATAAEPRVPVLVELFTSEGCSSCPPADRLLELLDQKQPIAGADLIVLSEHVDYWDHLGWKDSFSSASFTARQQAYSDEAYTPQMVVDGRTKFVGSDGRAAESAIRKALQEQKLPIQILNVERQGDKLTAHIESAAQGVMYVAIAEERAESQVSRGENAGHNLSHVAVARVLKQTGKDVSLKLPSATGQFRIIAFVQDPRTGQIRAVTSQHI